MVQRGDLINKFFENETVMLENKMIAVHIKGYKEKIEEELL